MKDAQELGSNYYTLRYQPPSGEANGKFRKVVVTLHDPNLHALTKTGYFSPEAGPQKSGVGTRKPYAGLEAHCTPATGDNCAAATIGRLC